MDAAVVELAQNFNQARPDMAHDDHRLFDVYRVLRETEPVKRVELEYGSGSAAVFAEGPGWVLSRYRDIVKVFWDNENFTSHFRDADDGAVPTEEVALDDIDPIKLAWMTQRIPILLDPPEFFAYRHMLNPFHTVRRAAEREDEARTLVNQLIDGVIATGQCEFMEDIVRPFPGILTCRILGLPEARWRFFIDAIQASSGEEQGMAEETSHEARADPRLAVMMAILEVAEQRRREPRDDLLTTLVNTTIEGRKLNNYEIAGMVSLLLSGGAETTISAISSALVYLGRHPDLRRRLQTEPSLIPSAAEEVLRMWPPLLVFWRRAKRSSVISDHQISAGDGMQLLLGSANRDPDEFPNSDEFIPDRHPNRHITFTTGIHRCIGSNFARMELRVALEEILRRFRDYTLVEEEVCLPPNFAITFGYRSVRATFPPSR